MSDAAPEVTIRMAEETLDALAGSGSFLYGLSAVRAADAAGRPAVWLQTRGYAMNTRVRPPWAFHAFTSRFTRPGQDGARVRPGFFAAAASGQTLVVAQPGGGGEVRERGAPDAVSLLNTTTTPLTGGLACMVDGEAVPVYAAPLYGGALQVIKPLPVLVLFVSPCPAPPGTLVSTTTGPGVLVHVDGDAACALEFHVNEGWSWAEGVRARAVPAQSDLVQLLVEYPAPGAADAGAE